MSKEIRQIISTHPHLGEIGHVFGTFNEKWMGEELIVLKRLNDYLPMATSPAMKQALLVASINALEGHPDSADVIMADVMAPFLFVNPSSPDYKPLHFGRPTDSSQQVIKASAALIAATRAARIAFEENRISPVDALASMDGSATNKIDHIGKPRLIEELLVAEGSSGALIALVLGGYNRGLISDEVMSLGLAIGGAAGVTEIIKSAYSKKRLVQYKETLAPFLFEQNIEHMPQLPVHFDLYDRAHFREIPFNPIDLEESYLKEVLGITRKWRNSHQVIHGKPFTDLSEKEYIHFMQGILYDQGQLRPLSQVLSQGLKYELALNHNQRHSSQTQGHPDGELSLNALPIITSDKLEHVPELAKKIGGMRLEGIKATARTVDIDKLPNDTPEELRKLHIKRNKHASKLPLYIAYPQLMGGIMYPDASWPGFISADAQAAIDDYRFHMSNGTRNYGGQGIAAEAMYQYWACLPSAIEEQPQYGKVNGYVDHFAQKLFKVLDQKGSTPISSITRNHLVGINGLNPYGQLVDSLLTASHYNPHNTEAKEGWVKEINKRKIDLLKGIFKNPQDLFFLLNTLSVETHIVHEGQKMINHFDAALNHKGSETKKEEKKGLQILKDGHRNISQTRAKGVEAFMGELERRAIALLMKPHKTITDGHDSLYVALSTIVREAPDLSQIISRNINNIFNLQGDFGSGSELDTDLLYVFYHLKKQLMGVSMDQNQQEIFNSYENFINSCGSHVLISLSRHDYVDKQTDPKSYVNNNIGFLRDTLFMGETSTINNWVDNVAQHLQTHLETGVLSRMDWRRLDPTSSERIMLNGLASAAEICLAELDNRITSAKQQSQPDKDLEGRYNSLLGRLTLFSEKLGIELNSASIRNVHHRQVPSQS